MNAVTRKNAGVDSFHHIEKKYSADLCSFADRLFDFFTSLPDGENKTRYTSVKMEKTNEDDIALVADLCPPFSPNILHNNGTAKRVFMLFRTRTPAAASISMTTTNPSSNENNASSVSAPPAPVEKPVSSRVAVETGLSMKGKENEKQLRFVATLM